MPPRTRRSGPRRSAGIVLYRRAAGATGAAGASGATDGALEVLLVHPGGPAWAKRDLGAWSIPKGEYEASDDAFAAARREFEEEIGSAPPDGAADDLGEVRQKSGKIVHAWALEGDLDVSTIQSNTFELEWPPRSGKRIEIPEVDRAEWFGLEEAREKMNPAQAELLDRLAAILP